MRLKNLQLVGASSRLHRDPINSQTPATTRYLYQPVTPTALPPCASSLAEDDQGERLCFRSEKRLCSSSLALPPCSEKRLCFREAGCQTSSLGIDWRTIKPVLSQQTLPSLPLLPPSHNAAHNLNVSPTMPPTMPPSSTTPTSSSDYDQKTRTTPLVPDTIRIEHHTPKMMSRHFQSFSSFVPTTTSKSASRRSTPVASPVVMGRTMGKSASRSLRDSQSPICSTVFSKSCCSKSESPLASMAMNSVKSSRNKVSPLVSMSSSIYTPAPTAYFTPAPSESPKRSKCNPEDLLRWESLLDQFREFTNYKDCTVPHSYLVDLQEQLLDKIQELEVTPIFILQSTLHGQSPPLSLKIPNFLVTKEERARLHQRVPKINDVLAEKNIVFFQRYQESTLKKTKGAAASSLHDQIEQFLATVGCGATGGRSPVGAGVRRPDDFPVCMFGVGPFDAQLNANLRPCLSSGPMKWKTFCGCCSPLRVSVLLETSSTQDFSEDEMHYLNALTSFLGRMCSDWQTHRIRVYYEESKRFQRFLPIMESISQEELAKNGWGTMRFDGSNLIHWKAISGGTFLTYMAGYVDTTIPEALTLIWDGDSHKSWIPFLTETKREYCVNPWGFVLSYAVGLPWPLSKRGLHFFGMSTDALLVNPLHAVQVWGYSIPETATTIFGVPTKATRKGQSVMEMELPAMSFSLTPVAPKKVYLSIVAMLDVKINFIPTALQTSMAKIMGTKMFGNVQKLCKEFDKGPYSKVLQELKDDIAPMVENVKTAEVLAAARNARK